MEIEVVTPKLNDKREFNLEVSNSQTNPITETHNETVKEELFETTIGGSTKQSITTNKKTRAEAQRHLHLK